MVCRVQSTSPHSSRVMLSSRSAEGARDHDDEADDDDDTAKATDDAIDYATRVLYHLRLCFDSEMIAISDASVAHKWLTAALVEVSVREETRVLQSVLFTTVDAHLVTC